VRLLQVMAIFNAPSVLYHETSRAANRVQEV
jgi:hypothetical protein